MAVRTHAVNLRLESGFFISDIAPADKPAYIEHFKEKQIYDQTGNIPFPYAKSDADAWIARVAAQTRKQGRSVNWALRRADGYLIGGIGFYDIELKKSHMAELGYWLAKPYWNRGIMTQAARKVVDFAFKELGLVRITAGVFDFNKASARVAEKAGFTIEGRMRKRYKKDGRFIDGLLYAITADPR